MAAILSRGCFVRCVWRKQFCWALAVRPRRLADDFSRLSVRLRSDEEQVGGLLLGRSPDVLGAVPSLLPAMPLLLAQHVFRFFAAVGFFRHEIGTVLRSLHHCWHSFVSLTAIWNCLSRRPRADEFSLSIVCSSAARVLRGRPGYSR